MGDRGARNEPATPADIEPCERSCETRSPPERSGSRPRAPSPTEPSTESRCPGTYAAEDELFGIGGALGDLGAGVFELAPAGVAGEDVVGPAKEIDWMRRLSAKIGRPVTFALVQVDADPTCGEI